MGLFLAELICIPAFIFEVTRALGGNTLSWAYVFEWPLLGGYAIYMWRKMLHDETQEHASPTNDVPAAVRVEPDDPELVAWNEYLARLHARPQLKEPEKRDD